MHIIQVLIVAFPNSTRCVNSGNPKMDQDTNIGGPHRGFPVTSHSAIVAARSADPQVRERALETIIASYWKPAYKYIRLKWQATNEDAKDLTQGFFAGAIAKDYFASYDAEKATFRTFLRTCLDRFVANQKQADQRLKRGGGIEHYPLDFADAEKEFRLNAASTALSPEDYFQREWVRSLFALAVDQLAKRYTASGRGIYFTLFERYDLADDETTTMSYASLANEFGLKVSDVTNYLAAARRDFRKIVLEQLRELTASDEEFRAEARTLLGVEVK
jgi:DNA-directed RNA polymerase specialized sigma24 family protein